MPLPIIYYAVGIGLGLITITAISYFWPKIINWLSTKVAPMIEEIFGIEEKNAFLEIISFLDNKITAVRRGVKSRVSNTIHLIRSIFIKSDDKYRRKDESYIKNKNNSDKVTIQTQTQEIDWNDIPDDIRASFIKDTKEEKSINWLDKNILTNINEV